MKRSFLSLFDNAPSAFDVPPCIPPSSRKKLKKPLQIDISDSFTDKSIFIPNSTTSSNSRKLSFNASPRLQSCCMMKSSTTPRCRCPERSFFSLESSLIFVENDTMYDDFYQEEEAFNITMKKCHRKKMEDRVTCESRMNTSGDRTFFFGIYDGHRNSYVSDFLQRNLHNIIQDFPDINSQPKLALSEAFNKIDQEVLKNQKSLNIQGGSTALCAYINSNSLHLANVGDSKAILIRNGLPVALNIEHRANNEEERKNVENRGGFIFEKKSQNSSRFLVQGALELTRSIGDPHYKEFITCEPDIVEYTFDKDDQYIIMASDGFWNEISEEETIKLINSFDKPNGLSNYLVGEALKRKLYSIDNISLIAIDVQKIIKASQPNK